MTSRRDTLIALSACSLASPGVLARDRAPLVAILVPDPDEGDQADVTARLARALALVGAPPLRFDFKGASGPQALLRAAKELVAERPAVIVAYGDAAARAASEAGPRIPVVAMLDDALGSNFGSSLRSPAGNITGVSVMGAELDSKRLEILAEVLPKGSAILLLGDRITTRVSRPQLSVVGQRLGLRLREADVSTVGEIGSALMSAKREGVAGVNVLTSLFLFQQSERIIAAVAEVRLPAIFALIRQVEWGGLLAYGPETEDVYQQFAELILKAIRGASAADLPFVQPRRFKLAINLKTARALNLTIPQSLLLRADSVIQ